MEIVDILGIIPFIFNRAKQATSNIVANATLILSFGRKPF
jgi:hypothetical protein